MASLIGLLLLLGALACGLITALWSERRRGGGGRRRDDDPPFERSRISLAGPEPEVPFSLRRRTLKICPDCRELVLLDAVACKYCGCSLAGHQAQDAVDARREK